jgi:hypothetical protein
MLAFKHRSSEHDYYEKACLQSAKRVEFFQYHLNSEHWDIEHSINAPLSKLTKDQKIEFILEILEKIKKEFNIEYVQIEYKKNSFIFNKPESTHLYDIYILVIFSRFLFSGDDFLVRTIERMYDLKNKYTAFESYIIASSDYHYGYYSINSHSNILDINKYRNLENKQILLNKSYRLNENMSNHILYKKGTVTDNNNLDVQEKYTVLNEEIEDYYFNEYKNPYDYICIINDNFIPKSSYCKEEFKQSTYVLINGKYIYIKSFFKLPLTEYIKTLKIGVRGNYLKGQKKYKNLEIFCNEQNININELLKKQ